MKRLLYLIIIITICAVTSARAIPVADADRYFTPDTVEVVDTVVEVVEEEVDNSSEIARVFAAVPSDMLPLLSVATRLDMVDYFAGGLSTRSTNDLEGSSRMTAMAPGQLTAEITEASDLQLTLLPGAGKYDVAALITTYRLNPSTDSNIEFLAVTTDSAGTVNVAPLEAGRLFKGPALDDWLTPQGRKNRQEIVNILPFLPVEYSINPADHTLTATLSLDDLVDKEELATLAPLIKRSLVYEWNGKKYRRK